MMALIIILKAILSFSRVLPFMHASWGGGSQTIACDHEFITIVIVCACMPFACTHMYIVIFKEVCPC